MSTFDQVPLLQSDFADNSEDRCSVLLLLAMSTSEPRSVTNEPSHI